MLGGVWCHAGRMTGGVWRHADRMTGGVWRHAGRMLGGVWRHADRMTGGVWRHAGRMLGGVWRHARTQLWSAASSGAFRRRGAWRRGLWRRWCTSMRWRWIRKASLIWCWMRAPSRRWHVSLSFTLTPDYCSALQERCLNVYNPRRLRLSWFGQVQGRLWGFQERVRPERSLQRSGSAPLLSQTG